MMANFNHAIEKTLKLEGGYANDSNDAGGETNYGITEAVARSYGYSGEMKDLDLVTAKGIYKTRYWDKLKLDEIESQPIAEKLFDVGVNCGVSKAASIVQRALNMLNRYQKDWENVKIDGRIGPVTARTINKAAERRAGNILKAVNIFQGSHYVKLAENPNRKDALFINGWLKNRIGF